MNNEVCGLPDTVVWLPVATECLSETLGRLGGLGDFSTSACHGESKLGCELINTT